MGGIGKEMEEEQTGEWRVITCNDKARGQIENRKHSGQCQCDWKTKTYGWWISTIPTLNFCEFVHVSMCVFFTNAMNENVYVQNVYVLFLVPTL